MRVAAILASKKSEYKTPGGNFKMIRKVEKDGGEAK